MSAVPDTATGRMVTDLRVDARTLAELYSGDTEQAAARLQSLNPSHRLPSDLTALALAGPSAQTRQLTSYLAHNSPEAWPYGIVSTMPPARGETVVRDNAVAVATVDAELKRPDHIGVIGYADSVSASTQLDVPSQVPETTASVTAGTGSAGSGSPTSPSSSTSPSPSTSTVADEPGVADTLAAVLDNKGQYVLPTANALSLGAADLVRCGADAGLADLPGPVTDPRAYPVSGEAFLAVPAALRDQAPVAAAQLAELLRYATRGGQSALPAGAATPPQGARASADTVADQLSALEPGGSPTASSTPTATPSETATGSPSGTPTATPSGSPTGSPSGTPTATPSGSPTGTPTESPSPSPSASPTQSATPTPSATSTATATPTPTGTASSATPTRSPTPTPSSTTTSAPTPVPSTAAGGGGGGGGPAAPAAPTGPSAALVAPTGAGLGTALAPTAQAGQPVLPPAAPVQPPEPPSVPTANTAPLTQPPVSPSALPGSTASAEPTSSPTSTANVAPPQVAEPPPEPQIVATKAGVSSPAPGGWFFPVMVGILALAFVLRALLNLGRPQR